MASMIEHKSGQLVPLEQTRTLGEFAVALGDLAEDHGKKGRAETRPEVASEYRGSAFNLRAIAHQLRGRASHMTSEDTARAMARGLIRDLRLDVSDKALTERLHSMLHEMIGDPDDYIAD